MKNDHPNRNATTNVATECAAQEIARIVIPGTSTKAFTLTTLRKTEKRTKTDSMARPRINHANHRENISPTLDPGLLTQAREVAALRGKSLSRLVEGLLLKETKPFLLEKLP